MIVSIAKIQRNSCLKLVKRGEYNMSVVILALSNCVIGSMIRTTFYRYRNQSRSINNVVFKRILFAILFVLISASYIMQISLIISGDYKLALCMNIICIFAIIGLNSTVYSEKNCEK